jgi:hypothetical protein
MYTYTHKPATWLLRYFPKTHCKKRPLVCLRFGEYRVVNKIVGHVYASSGLCYQLEWKDGTTSWIAAAEFEVQPAGSTQIWRYTAKVDGTPSFRPRRHRMKLRKRS